MFDPIKSTFLLTIPCNVEILSSASKGVWALSCDPIGCLVSDGGTLHL